MGRGKLLGLLVVIFSLIEEERIILTLIGLIWGGRKVIDSFCESRVGDCR